MNNIYLFNVDGFFRFSGDCPNLNFNGEIVTLRTIENNKDESNKFLGVIRNTSKNKLRPYEEEYYVIGIINDSIIKGVKLNPDISGVNARATRASIISLEKSLTDGYSGYQGSVDLVTAAPFFRENYGIGPKYTSEIQDKIAIDRKDAYALAKVQLKDIMFYVNDKILQETRKYTGSEFRLEISEKYF